MSEQMLINYALYSRDIMIIDTTFNQTKYKWFLLTIIGVSSTFEPVLMGVAMISHQKEADFVWIFDKLKNRREAKGF